MAMPSDRIVSRRPIRVRAASEADMPAVGKIYTHYVLHSLATFEETPPTLEEMLARRRASVELGLPYLIAEAGSETVGFAYAAAYRPRPAYRFTIEDSVYVADGELGRGIGSALLGELIAACERGPWRQMLAVAATAPTPARSRCIGASVSSLWEICDRSASSLGAGSTRRFCSGRWGRATAGLPALARLSRGLVVDAGNLAAAAGLRSQ